MDDDEQRFRRLFDEAYRPLMAYALRRVADRASAEDVVAETFTIAWRRRGALPDGDRARPYLFGIARRVIANEQRSRRRWSRLVARLRQQPIEDPEPRVSDPRVAAALAALPQRDREVLRLAAWDGLANEDIAIVLGLSPSGVASQLQRAREHLASALAAAGVERTPPKGGGTR